MKHFRDIAYCKVESCDRKFKCYRYNAYKEITEQLQDEDSPYAISVLVSVDNPSNCKLFMIDNTLKK